MRFPFFHTTPQDNGDDVRPYFRDAQTPRLSPDAKQRMRAVVLAAFDARVTDMQAQRYKQRSSSFLPLQNKLMIPIVAAVIILLGGTFGTAAIADSAKPGDALYGVDRTAENIRLFLTANDTGKARIKADIAAEREQERQRLEAEGKAEQLAQAEEHADSALTNAIETISAVRAKMEDRGNDQSHAEDALLEVEQKLEDIREMREDRTHEEDTTGLTEAEVKIYTETALVKVKMDGVESRFTVLSTDTNAIVTEIANVTGATEEEVRAVVKFENEDLPDDTTDDDTSDDADDDTNVNTNTNADDLDDGAQESEQESEQEQNQNTTNTNNTEQEQNQNENQVRNEIRVQVNREDGKAEIRTKVNNREMEWELNTTNQNTILLSISAKTGLSSSQIQATWQYRVED